MSDLEPSEAADVVWLARGIMTTVYMDAMDSIVYATALVAAATHLVTTDGRLKTVVNRFKNPDCEEAKENAQAVSSWLMKCTGMNIPYREFPVSQTISKLCP